jgi:hypothetical protein
MIPRKQATAAESSDRITSPPRAQIYRERANGFRERAHTASRDVRKDLENIALQYELVAESIEREEKQRCAGQKPKE